MKIGDEIYVHGYIDEIRKDVVIIKNDGGYFGTVPSEITAFEQEPILDKIRAEISALKSHHINDCYDDGFQGCRTNVLHILDKYKVEREPQESDIEKRKPCINYEDGCEEWAGCPCVHYKAESEE